MANASVLFIERNPDYNTRAARRARAEVRDFEMCLWCGHDLSLMRRHAKFCSNMCSMKAWHLTHPDHQRQYTLKSVYGITKDDFDRLLQEQSGLCAICREEPKGQWNVDHDHDTGEVRGLLCSPCNIGIGQLRDDPRLLLMALNYLESRQH